MTSGKGQVFRWNVPSVFSYIKMSMSRMINNIFCEDNKIATQVYSIPLTQVRAIKLKLRYFDAP